ncbi:Rap1-interacting factor 1 N terminal-domain-containing protein [Cercophora newfieldiana]|uniref:Rap1-interacting factor 1 N terminal-domain-containing protein n=1 Tax=Cercophora newfieldiana TaxID=92897 RepID=A0AA40D0H4_9PEZI|nr:Rap1-interacting factor 1 N terminal-domain-containing protein [Cercophora newfieldiana]
MSTGTVMSSILESLPPRPPTPPRETQHESFAAARLVLGPADTRSNVHTPPGVQSPGGSITTNSTTRRSRKKVEFSAKAEYRDPPVLAQGEAKAQHPTPVSLPRSASKPVKSILKITHHAANPLGATNGDAGDPSNPETSLAEMLESTIQQLAGGDRDSKVDAYMMLTRACKTSNNLPDRVALQEKMSLFTQFIQRDITSRSQEGGADASLGNHALNLLITFLGFPAIASAISNEFGVFVIDHCIRSFEDASVPKDVARHLMKVISVQNFSAKVMSPDRVGRLISSLHNISEHINGKSIIMSRVVIYRKLVKQCKQLMVLHSDWLPDLFTDMLSNLKEIRTSAISLGLETSFSIGHEKQLSRKVVEMFDTPVSDEARYIEVYQQKLQAMSKDRNESVLVPDIWSVVILLLRIPLNRWDGCKPWLAIMQTCFNSSDFPTKINANRAWGRLVFLMQCEERGFPKRLPTLINPLTSQLRRRGPGKSTEELRNTILGGICNLFYYVFKPNTKPALLDTYWDAGAKPVFATLLDPRIEAENDNVRQATLILGGLFDCRTPRRWREDRIVENSPVKPEELPPIDAKWIRGNANKVFEIVGPILEKDIHALAQSESAALKLWQSLVTTVASAASKEIKVSKDTVVFMTEAFDVLHKIWASGLAGETQGTRATEFLAAAQAFVQTMIDSLGHLPFTEKPGKNYGSAKAPLYQLFSTLSSLPPGVPDNDEFAKFFNSIFSPFFVSKSDKAKMDLAQELLTMIPMESPRPYGPWLLVSSQISAWLGSGQSSHLSTASGIETPVGNDYREIVKVLERGFRSTPKLPWEHWESLFYTLSTRVRDETGDAGFGLVAVEPLAKALVDMFAVGGPEQSLETPIRCVTELLSVATQPRDRQAFDAARRRLWGTSLAGGRSSSFDVFDHLYKAVSEALGYLYENYSADDSAHAVRLLKELDSFFERGNRQLFLKAVLGVQDGVLPWIHDARRVLTPNSTALAITTSLWNKVAASLPEVEHPEQQLEVLEHIFCASLDSAHRHIANSAVSLWNKLFENAQELDYPEQLKAALSRLQPHVDIIVPGLEISSTDYAGQQPMFIDSVDDLSLPRLPSTASSHRGTPRPLSARAVSPELGSFDMNARQQLHSTPAHKSSEASRHRTTPKLRHDDSQVEFAPIHTSPGQHELESQILTERQMEVRERQKENAVLFPEIRSSPGLKQKEADPTRQSRASSPKLPTRSREVATPERERAFDSYVSSTPTPRRGQPVPIPEHDMPDLPSSPPEPRGNPLAAEIRSRSASNSLLDEWQFSSSPISGSPNPIRQAPEPEEPEELPEADEDPLHEDEHGLATSQDESVEVEGAERSFSAEDEIVEDTILPDLPRNPLTVPVPSTPRRTTRSMNLQETPKSDNDVFVDAPTSPLPPTPKRSERIAKSTRASRLREAENVSSQTPSIAGSDVSDRSSVQLVIELDAGKIKSSDYRRPTESPDKKPTAEVADCIVVGDSPTKLSGKAASRNTRAGSTIPPVASTTGEEEAPGSQQGPRQKRKRKSSRAHETSSRKRRHHSLADEDNTAEVPDSQPSSALKARPSPQPINDRRPRSARSGTATTIRDFGQRFPSAPLASSRPRSRGGKASLDLVEIASSQAHDREAQSQIALEAQISSSQKKARHAEPVAPAPVDVEAEAMDVDVDMEQPPAEEQVDEQPESHSQSQDVPSSQGYMQKFISILRSGAELLLSAPSASTQEVWEAEDALLEVTRALHEVKRRDRR